MPLSPHPTDCHTDRHYNYDYRSSADRSMDIPMSTNPIDPVVDSILNQIKRRTGIAEGYREKVEHAIKEAQAGTDAGVTVIRENGFYCNGKRVRLISILDRSIAGH